MTEAMITLKWWLIIFLTGIAVWPLVSRVFCDWRNKAYLLAKTAGLGLLSLTVWLSGSIGGWELNFWSAAGILILIAAAGWSQKERIRNINLRAIAAEEILFGMCFLTWTWVKAHAPDINGLEKFMDFGFAQSILQHGSFPPPDMWFAGTGINYYYFGHLMMAVLSRLSGVELAYGFNLMLATLFALTFTMTYALGRELLKRTTAGAAAVSGAILIALLVSLSGNLQTIYAFTRGYSSEDPPPFWNIMSNPFDKEGFRSGWQSYWYPNATRFIPFTIHEFPGYSFVVSDIHGHVLAIPLALFLISLLVNYWQKEEKQPTGYEAGIYGITAGAIMMTNALDGLIYIGLLIFIFAAKNWPLSIKLIKPAAVTGLITGGAMLVTMAPFLTNFKPFVSGVAVNCPPAFLAEKTFGPVIFEGTEKCQKSPIWMMALLWGFFAYWAGVMLITVPETERNKKLAVGISLFCLGLIIFPEYFYFKDIYPAHFRSNTMFKLGYQVFILMSIVSGWTINYLWAKRKVIKHSGWYLLTGLPLFFLVMIYPYFSVRSYFGGLKEYQGLYGLEWMKSGYPENWAVINWLNSQPGKKSGFAILEAQGDSYQDPVSGKPYNQISTFTGIPTVAGWYVHEWLWRGQNQIAERSAEVREIYETTNADTALAKLRKYKVKYVIVGEMEREKYKRLNQDKFDKTAFSGQTRRDCRAAAVGGRTDYFRLKVW